MQDAFQKIGIVGRVPDVLGIHKDLVLLLGLGEAENSLDVDVGTVVHDDGHVHVM